MTKDLDHFMVLSRVLVGREDLDRSDGARYFQTLCAGAADMGFSRADLDRVLLASARATGKKLEKMVAAWMKKQSGAESIIAKSILSLWYCAGLIDLKRGPGYLIRAAPRESFGRALIWEAVGGHAMGSPGRYFGNWAYPPGRSIAPPPPRPKGYKPRPKHGLEDE